MKTTLESMQDLYVEQLADLLSAEKQLVRALPKAVKAAQSPQLQAALGSHLEQTQQHVQRLEQVLRGLDQKIPSHKCPAMEGIIEEAGDILGADGDPAVKDAAIIAAAQRMEHYEIAGYGCARTFAHTLGREEDVKILQSTLDEEYAADQYLSDLAQTSINQRAVQS